MVEDRGLPRGAHRRVTYPWHSDARKAFEAYVGGGRVPHAVLVAGSSGCGKVELARDIARELLCLEAAPGGCGRCRSCLLFRGRAHPDYREVSFELRDNSDQLSDEIRVPQIRRLIEALYKTTTTSPRKVALIHPAERMNRSAANALLKTLEEPVGDTVLILVAHDASRLPATVRSRCQRLPVGMPARGEALEWLAQAGAAPGDAEEALAAAAGRPLEAQAMLESGALEHYRGAMRLLERLHRGSASDGQALAALADLDPASLWSWLSLRCAELVRRSLDEDAAGRDVRLLVALQGLADRNRILAATPVRKDLLLRDWLIQWKNLPATLPLNRQEQEA